jgi:hypothetical protein
MFLIRNLTRPIWSCNDCRTCLFSALVAVSGIKLPPQTIKRFYARPRRRPARDSAQGLARLPADRTTDSPAGRTTNTLKDRRTKAVVEAARANIDDALSVFEAELFREPPQRTSTQAFEMPLRKQEETVEAKTTPRRRKDLADEDELPAFEADQSEEPLKKRSTPAIEKTSQKQRSRAQKHVFAQEQSKGPAEDALSAFEADLFTEPSKQAWAPAFEARTLNPEKQAVPTASNQQQNMSPNNLATPASIEVAEEHTDADPATSELASYMPSQLNPDLPWYLQVQQPKRKLDADNPMAERQKLPELPSDSPPQLSSLVEHLSVDIGLDYLTLLDLRALDPPPALGATLLMIIGTARSEKHLHVSADRFCRHLRTNYKLTPFADGLLGRNEWKLKMRRKNRRAKLMANAGVVSPENVDDGIRTGWVCVHAGQVEPKEGTKKEVRVIEGFVGFGAETDKVTIVVQMLTEEKREELDLEGLWTGLLERNLRKQKYRDEGAEEFEAAREAGNATVVTPGSVDGPPEGGLGTWNAQATRSREARIGG